MSTLAGGQFPLAIMLRLRAAQFSKNLLLVTALRQALSRLESAGANLIEKASAVLADVQLGSPDVVAEALRLPHLSMWAADSFSRLRLGRHHDDVLSAEDLAPLAAIAAVAALQARHSFELTLPIRNGTIELPSLGQVRLEPSDHSRWASIRADENGVLISSTTGQLRLPLHFHHESSCNWPNWTPVPRMRVEAEGLTLEAIVDGTDAFLSRLGPAINLVERSWQLRIAAAWAILARHHRSAAVGLAAVLTTLVPLAEARFGRPNSATSGWAWGAIGLSFIDDELLLAETLVHEFHHLVLAAVEDLTPLVEAGTEEPRYVAWRDDARPVAAILHGTFAQLAVTNYWGRQRKVVERSEAFRCDVEFARARRAGLAGANALSESPLLTSAGRIVADRMRDQLAVWQHEHLPDSAEAVAADIAAEHRLRWRIAHLRPDERSIQMLAAQWLEFGEQADVRLEPEVRLDPWNKIPGSELAALLELRYRDPARLSKLRGGLTGVAAVHLTLLDGDEAQAQADYLRLVLADGNTEAWIGLILARRRLSGRSWSFPIQGRPEIAIAVHERVRAIAGFAADSEEFVEWLARNWLDSSSAER